ncbi:hypothetical protein A0128_16240 [Leptospira tipperaryensis]|uniref:Uncharacterized protein n=1 Tax=Leptospira tipperaryensis TaxID=2564040 RepID=A0A1D7V093_9LEPT|nr:hypothetical protein A0128_16240 [Leptospira tipperaryensis]
MLLIVKVSTFSEPSIIHCSSGVERKFADPGLKIRKYSYSNAVVNPGLPYVFPLNPSISIKKGTNLCLFLLILSNHKKRIF